MLWCSTVTGDDLRHGGWWCLGDLSVEFTGQRLRACFLVSIHLNFHLQLMLNFALPCVSFLGSINVGIVLFYWMHTTLLLHPCFFRWALVWAMRLLGLLHLCLLDCTPVWFYFCIFISILIFNFCLLVFKYFLINLTWELIDRIKLVLLTWFS